jgi:crotonobetainyl-CoA:carnitine CoA-transferase CaiB-like acyl-CoA transferase
MTRAALAGIKIADFSRVLAGPYATMLLADLGAEVVKVERPVTGDETRSWIPPVDSKGKSTYFQSVNRNKTGITLDLSSEADQVKARQLIVESDVVVENFGAGGMRKFGLDYETIKKLNPKIIYCSITGFGSQGPLADLPGYDMLVQAMSGLMSITGDSDGEPTKVGVAVIDVIAGLHATTGILAALHSREKSGIGQKVEIDLFSSALSGMANQSGAFAAAGVNPSRIGNHHPSIVPYGVFKAKDRDLAIAIGNDKQYESFAKLIGLTENKYPHNIDRVKNREQLIQVINSKLSMKIAEAWIELFRKNGIPAGPINTIAEAFDFAKNNGLEAIIDVAGEKSVANPIKLSGTPVSYYKGSPNLN